MENIFIDGVNIGKVLHNGKGMCIKAKEMILNLLEDGAKVIIIDPEIEWNEINKVINKV